jgi:hypothetical protein
MHGTQRKVGGAGFIPEQRARRREGCAEIITVLLVCARTIMWKDLIIYSVGARQIRQPATVALQFYVL